MEKNKKRLVKWFDEHVSPGKLKAYRLLEMDFVPGRREGCRIWELGGKRSFINCRASGGVFNLGHRPPEIVKALKKAANSLDIGDHLLMSGWRAKLAKRLADLMPGDIQYTVFGVGGGEAVDLAIKLARGHTRRPGIVSAVGGYHGHTGFALATGVDEFKEYFGPLAPGFTQVPFGDIEAFDRAVTKETAAVIFETIPATLGVAVPPDDFYPAVRRICDERGAVMIIDEVQAGLMRTGRMWAIDEYGVTPDIMVLAKGLAGAMYPMSATCYRPHLQKFFDDHPFVHISTMGGAELGCAVALATLERLADPALAEHVNDIAGHFNERLKEMKKARGKVFVELRQKGLMIGLKMAGPQFGPLMTIALARRGVLAMFAHNDQSVMIIMPPLIISAAEVDEVLEAIDGSLVELEKFAT